MNFENIGTIEFEGRHPMMVTVEDTMVRNIETTIKETATEESRAQRAFDIVNNEARTETSSS